MNPILSTFKEFMETFGRLTFHTMIHVTKKQKISMPQLGALMHIHRNNVKRVSDLGSHLEVSCAATSQMLDRLVDQKLISRIEDPNDRRAKKLDISEKGLELISQLFHSQKSWLTKIIQSLDENEEALVDSALKLLVEKVKNLNINVFSF
jgi:DNA-binding MarR family transcriptional regulator